MAAVRLPAPLFCGVVVAGALAAPGSARAQSVVVSCADVATAGVEATTGAAFSVFLDRDPATASAADVRLTVFDPDTDGEVSAVVNSTALPAFDNNDGNYNNRKFSYATTVAKTALVQGANTITFTDANATNPFAIHRICIGLVGAAVPATLPATERFCDPDIKAPTLASGNGGNSLDVLPSDTVTVSIDRAVGPDVGVEFVVFDKQASADLKTLTLTPTSGTAVSASFTGAAAPDHYVVGTAPAPSTLVTGANGAATSNDLTVTASFDARLWDACILVSAPPQPDAGFVTPDAGSAPNDAGFVVDDAGVSTPADAGVSTPVDAGSSPADAGGSLPADAGAPGEGEGEGDADGGPGDADDGGAGADPQTAAREQAAQELASIGFETNGGCASTAAGPVGRQGATAGAIGALLVVGLASRRRRR